MKASIEYPEFEKVDMRVGTIIEANVFAEARKPALKLQIDFGPIGILKSSAQITERYDCQNLIGKQIVAVINFPSKQIGSFMSECLVLGAVSDPCPVSLLSPNHPVPNGTPIS